MQNTANVIKTEINATRRIQRLIDSKRGKFYSAWCSAKYEIHANLPNLDELRPWPSMGTITATWTSPPSDADEQFIVDIFGKHFRFAEANVKLHWHEDKKSYLSNEIETF